MARPCGEISMTFPACFTSQSQWDQWNVLRRISAEKVTICHDCTPEYHDRMILEGKCQKEQFMPEKQSKTKVYPLNKLKKCNQCGTQDQAEFSPKNFWTCRVCANARKQAWKRSVSNVRTHEETIKSAEQQTAPVIHSDSCEQIGRAHV